MNKIPYKSPQYYEKSYNCPFCGAYAKQNWFQLEKYGVSKVSPYKGVVLDTTVHDLLIAICENCNDISVWYLKVMIYPKFSGIEPPNSDLSSEIKTDYKEAAEISQKSPRGAAALLRLSIQKLCTQLGEKDKDLNVDIKNLVAKGLPVKVQQSLDAVRVIGNEAVHPGVLDIKDDVKTVSSLFKLVNFIAEKMISEQKEIDEIYNKLPENKKEQIKKRDEN